MPGSPSIESRPARPPRPPEHRHLRAPAPRWGPGSEQCPADYAVRPGRRHHDRSGTRTLRPPGRCARGFCACRTLGPSRQPLALQALYRARDDSRWSAAPAVGISPVGRPKATTVDRARSRARARSPAWTWICRPALRPGVWPRPGSPSSSPEDAREPDHPPVTPRLARCLAIAAVRRFTDRGFRRAGGATPARPAASPTPDRLLLSPAGATDTRVYRRSRRSR